MISERSIEKKDFSCNLPRIISKLKVITTGLNNEMEDEDRIDEGIIYALIEYAEECIKDLEIINKTLYWPDEHEKAV